MTSEDEHLELAAEVGDDRDQRPDGAHRKGQDDNEHHTDDGQGTGVEVGGEKLRDTDERTPVLVGPGFNGVVPALDRASTVSTDEEESHEEPDGEDSGGEGDEQSDGPGGSSGLADRLGGAPREMLCVWVMAPRRWRGGEGFQKRSYLRTVPTMFERRARSCGALNVNHDRKRQHLSIPGSVRSRFKASCLSKRTEREKGAHRHGRMNRDLNEDPGGRRVETLHPP
jgi:hypothetical protein